MVKKITKADVETAQALADKAWDASRMLLDIAEAQHMLGPLEAENETRDAIDAVQAVAQNLITRVALLEDQLSD